MEKVTKNRFPTTDDSDDDAGSPMKFGEGSGGHQASACIPFKLWQRGVEVPTLVSENPAAVELCLAILAGSLVDYPEIFVSEAVAVQIYLLRQRNLELARTITVYLWFFFLDIYIFFSISYLYGLSSCSSLVIKLAILR